MHTWQSSVLGVPWDEFPIAYALVALIALATSVTLRLVVIRLVRPAVRSRDLLPTELGMLMSPRHALLAGMAQLSVAGLVNHRGLTKSLTAHDIAALDPLAVTMTYAYADPRVRTLGAVADVCKYKLRHLHTELVDAGLLAGPGLRVCVAAATTPLLLAGFLGCMGFFGTPGGATDVVIILLEFLGVLGAAVWFLERPPRLTAAGKDALKRAREKSAYLHPNNKPALRTYGVAHSGVAAALFGGAALWLVDAPFAHASKVNQAVEDAPLHVHSPILGSASGGGGTCAGASSGAGCGGGSGCGSGGCGGGGCGGGS